jgi:hypothetical protein
LIVVLAGMCGLIFVGEPPVIGLSKMARPVADHPLLDNAREVFII